MRSASKLILIFLASLFIISSCAKDNCELIVIDTPGTDSKVLDDTQISHHAPTVTSGNNETQPITEPATNPISEPSTDSESKQPAESESEYIPTVQETETEVSIADSYSIVINISSKTFHIDPNCRHVKRMKEENKIIIECEDPSALISQGYKACKTCSSEYVS